MGRANWIVLRIVAVTAVMGMGWMGAGFPQPAAQADAVVATGQALAPKSPAVDLIVYDEALMGDWDANWSWDATFDPSSTAQAHSGSRSIAITYDAGWAGFLIRTASAVDGGSYDAIEFWAFASGNTPVSLYTESQDSGGASTAKSLTLVGGGWAKYSVTMSQLGNPAQIKRITLQNNTAGAQPVFYVDDLRLISNAPPAGLTGEIRIQASGIVTPIDSRLLGTNLTPWDGGASFYSNPTFIARTRASGVTVLRMPGGSWANTYGWLSCEMGFNVAGALECRAYDSSDDSYFSILGWSARPTDYLNFLKAVGKPGMWVVSANGTSKEAAAAVAFFNSRITDTTPIGVDIRGTNWYTAGHWAQLRMAHGNPEPLGIKLWALGNELFAPAQCGGWEPSWTCEGTEYVNGDGTHEGYLAFRAAMRAVDPGIELGAVGVTSQSGAGNWGNEVIAAAGDVMDFYDVHQYAYYDPPAVAQALAQPVSGVWPAIMAGVRASFDAHAGGRRAPVGATEWNLFSVWSQDAQGLMIRAVNGLHVADTLGQIIQSGYALANHYTLATGDVSTTPPLTTNYSLLRPNLGWQRSPQYFAFVLWARFGGQMLPVTTTFNAATQLSVYAGRVDDGTLSVLAINKSGEPVAAAIGAPGLGVFIDGEADVVEADALMDTAVRFNGVAEAALADDLSNAPAQLVMATGGAITYTFASNSVTLVRLNTATAVQLQPRAFVAVVMR